jgi:hypothetical protein
MMYFIIFLIMMFGGLSVVFALLFGPGLAFVIDGKMMFLKLLYTLDCSTGYTVRPCWPCRFSSLPVRS